MTVPISAPEPLITAETVPTTGDTGNPHYAAELDKTAEDAVKSIEDQIIPTEVVQTGGDEGNPEYKKELDQLSKPEDQTQAGNDTQPTGENKTQAEESPQQAEGTSKEEAEKADDTPQEADKADNTPQEEGATQNAEEENTATEEGIACKHAIMCQNQTGISLIGLIPVWFCHIMSHL